MPSKYGKVENGIVVKIYESRPKWFYDNREPVTDEYLLSQDIYPIILNELTSFDSRKEVLIINPKESLVVDEENKIIRNYYSKMNKTITQIFEEKCNGINTTRDSYIYSDVIYRFPDTEYPTEEDYSHIQVRSEIDLRNISANGISAMKDIIENNLAAQHLFLDRENVLHTLTPSQMLEMANYVKTIGQSIYSISWIHKHQNLKGIIDNISLTDEEKLDALVSYDDNQLWPVKEEIDIEEYPEE
jgi:hypothetical protein